MRKISWVLVASGVLLVLAVQAASADVIFDNLSLPSGGDLGVLPDQSVAQEFGAPAASTLQNVILGMDNASVLNDPFTVQIWSDVAGPSASLVTLTGNSSPSIAGNYTYTPPGTFALTAGTNYWVVATAPGPLDAFAWLTTFGVPPAIVSGGFLTELNSGSGWLPAPRPMKMQVNAELRVPVPEPGTMTLLMMGLPVGLAWRRRRA